VNSDIPLYCFIIGFCILAVTLFYGLFVVATRDEPITLSPPLTCECPNNTVYVYPTCPAAVQEQAPATILDSPAVAPTPTPYSERRANPDGYPRVGGGCCGEMPVSEFPFLGGA
jgi:hypothetical protein